MQQYLESSEFIDWDCPEIIDLAENLKIGLVSDVDIARACFEYVRDSILHTSDFRIDVITVKASEVLRHKTGYCYAKSHLLAALLRANEIPSGLCYQRLSITGRGGPYSLHGLNAVYLSRYGWYRLDARGNKEGVNADFIPPVEQLAFPVNNPLEDEDSFLGAKDSLLGAKGSPLKAEGSSLKAEGSSINSAMPVPDPEEFDMQGIWAEPLQQVVSVLKRYDSYIDVDNNLPDVARF